jgi:hypothetical protein
MEKTREALATCGGYEPLPFVAAALAEVEEWEAARRKADLNSEGIAYLADRAEAAEAELFKANEVRRVLTELLHDVWRSYTLLDGDQAHLDHSMEAVEALLFGDQS